MTTASTPLLHIPVSPKEYFTTKKHKKALESILKAYKNNQLHPVIRSVVSLAISGNPKQYAKEEEVGLILEGGGISSLASCYMAGALEILGWVVLGIDIQDCFKVIVGSSGGGLNAALFAGGLATFAKDLGDHFVGPPFINSPMRERFPFISPKNSLDLLLGKTKFINIDYLKKMLSESPLGKPPYDIDYEKLLLIATRVDKSLPATIEARRFLYSNFTGKEDMISGICATCHIPFGAGWKPYGYRDMYFTDGTMIDRLPYEATVTHLKTREEKKSQVLVLASVPKGIHLKISLIEVICAKTYMRIIDPALTPFWLTYLERAHVVRELLYQKQEHADGPDYARIISPPSSVVYAEIFEKNPIIVRKMGEASARSVFAAFGVFGQEQDELMDIFLSA